MTKSILNARLLPEEVPGIRERVRGDPARGIAPTTTVYQEADRYGVGVETIRRCVRGETFRFVKEGLPATEPDAVGPRYGRRAGDVVSTADAKASEDAMRKRLDEAKPYVDPVDEFLASRETQPKENDK